MCMKPLTFVSIDVDYFNPYSVRYETLSTIEEFFDALYGVCLKRGIPLTAVMNHQQMLPLVDKSEARRLINFDQYSDLANNDIDELSCGTWVNYVHWRREGTYIWKRCDDAEWVGECGYSFDKGLKRLRDWKGCVSHYEPGLDISMLSRMNISEVCVCMSPSFAEEDLQDMFREWVKKYKIPYTRGRLREEFGVMRYPSDA